MRIIAIGLLGLTLWSGVARAQVPTLTLWQAHEDAYREGYVYAMTETLSLAGALCLPVPMSRPAFLSMTAIGIQQLMRTDPRADHSPIASVVATALKQMFPCAPTTHWK
jgi:hypothetical protein